MPSSGDLSFTSLVSEWTSPPLPLKSIITQEMSASYRLIHDGGGVEKVGLQFRTLSSILRWGLQDTKEQTIRIRCVKRSGIYLVIKCDGNSYLMCIKSITYTYCTHKQQVQKFGLSNNFVLKEINTCFQPRPQVTLKTFIILQIISSSNKCCSFECSLNNCG